MEELNNKPLTPKERERILNEMLELLKSGEDRNLRLSKALGIATPTVRRLRKMLIESRKDNRKRDRRSSRKKKGKRKRPQWRYTKSTRWIAQRNV